MATDSSLFPEEALPDRFKTAQERYGVWPTTVWPVDHADKKHRTLRDAVGDEGAVREVPLYRGDIDEKSIYRGKLLASIFSPALCSYILNCYAPEEGLVIDPFAGGGTRAIMAAARGLRYAGTELREEEVEAVAERCEAKGYGDRVAIYRGDARYMEKHIGEGVGDFCYTCPPYFDLETYKGGPEDLSECANYEEFCGAIGEVAQATRAALKTGAKSCWVVGLHRDAAGSLLPLHHDTTRAHQAAGFRLLEEVVVHHTGTPAIQRVGQFEKGSKRLVRVHEYLLVLEAQ